LSEADVRPPRGLPEALPDGERILWQRSPAWRPYARRVFQLYKAALYFGVLVAWVAISAAGDGGADAALRSLAWTLPPALGVLAILALLGWLYARTTIYTVTDKRLVIQSGLAVPASINLPFSRVQSADLKAFADGTGDIELEITGDRVLYSMLWPNLRLFRLTRPKPVLRALTQPQQAAEMLGEALQLTQQAEARPSDPAHGDGEGDGSDRRRAITA